MSKVVSVLSGVAVMLLLLVLGGTLIHLAASEPPDDQVTSSGVGTAFTYQGYLTDGQGPANGPFDLTFSLYDDPEGGSQVGTTISRTVTITGGLLSLDLDFGAVFEGTALWLEIAVRPAGDAGPYTTLLPRQRLAPTPLAIFASSAPWTGLTGMPGGFGDDVDDDTLAGLTCLDGQLPKWDEASGQWACTDDLDTDTTYQPGVGLTLSGTMFAISSTYQLPQACAISQTVKWDGSAWVCGTDELGAGGSAWLLAGNAGTSTTTDFLGTTDSQALELRVNGSRALRLEPSDSSPNILGGYSGNRVEVDVYGATIGGGGRDFAINQVAADFGAIGGGAGNSAEGYAATVGGGEGNHAGDPYATIGGGLSNTAGGRYAIVGGGRNNTGTGTLATIAGGGFNRTGADYATVGGGGSNVVSGTFGTIPGGQDNQVTGTHASVGGGSYNRVAAAYGTIAGGGPSDTGNPTTTNNRVFDDYGTVGGGGNNVAGDVDGDPTVQPYATVGGGKGNVAGDGYATVGGGSGNTAGDYGATVGGGVGNTASNQYTTVGGGRDNVASNRYATVGGGYTNTVSAAMGAIGGGYDNLVTGNYGAIPGGMQNVVGASYGFAAGRLARAEHQGAFVWSDSSSIPFASTGPDQFLISAAGGVGIGTNAPSHMLSVEGSAVILSSDVVSVSVIYSHSRTLDAPNAVYAAGDMLYVTSYSTNTLSIWNVSNPEEVVPVGYTTSSLVRPSDLFVSGQRAYVTSESNNRLVVFDLSNPSAPDSLGSTGEGLANPVALYVAGKYAYVASNGPGTMDGLAILDVSDPIHIRLCDFISANLLGPSDVFVAGSHAYVTSEANNRLVIFDVSDPRPGQIKARGSATGPLNSPQAVFVSGPYAYVVADGSDNLVIFDISDPNNIVTVGSTGTNLANPLDVFVAGDLAYVASSGNNRLVVFDISDPANIVALGFAETGAKPVSLFMAGKQIYVANENGNSVGIYEVTHLEAPTLQTGNLQTAYLDVIDNAAISNDLAVHGGLQVGSSGARIGGALSVAGSGDSHILGALSVGGAGALISDTVVLTRTQWITAPTHAIDVIGEGRFRVNDYTNLVLRSANAGSDEDAYIDLIRSDQTIVLTPSARIEFDVADPFTHTTSMRFYTQGGDDAQLQSRLEITSNGDVRPGADAKYLLGIPGRRWHTIYSANGIQTTSDGRLKENVIGLPYGLDAVRHLRPVAFTWKDGTDDRQHYGLIAQEVAHFLPDVVMADGDADRTLSMNYAEIVPVLVKAIQEQQDEIDTQAEQIAALEARLAALEEGQPEPAGAANPLTTLGFGGLVLGVVVVAGIWRNRD